LAFDTPKLLNPRGQSLTIARIYQLGHLESASKAHGDFSGLLVEGLKTVREQNRAPQSGQNMESDAHKTGARSGATQATGSQRQAASNDSWEAEAQDNNIVPLTRDQAEELFGPEVSRPSRVTPWRVVAAQMVLSLGATLVWWLFYKPPGDAALSAFLGGAICWVPSALFAARLKAKSGAETIMSWMIGEALKMGATIAMFVAIAYGYKSALWLPLLVTYIVALKTYWVAMALR
jgi:ATP synthase protein I